MKNSYKYKYKLHCFVKMIMEFKVDAISYTIETSSDTTTHDLTNKSRRKKFR